VNVRLVSTWNEACGIAEHSAMLKEAVQGADPLIEIVPDPEALDPYKLLYAIDWTKAPPDVVHLNYQAALHSRWGPEQIAKVQALGSKVLVTYHDSGVPNSDHCKQICQQADYFVVHEPYDDLPEHGEYLRMGVQDWRFPYLFDTSSRKAPLPARSNNPFDTVALGGRPVLGTVGFAFPWKCYDELARVTKQCGWGLLLIAPDATVEQIRRWHDINPWTHVVDAFANRDHVISLLSSCDATAFTYVTHNTGQSGAILQGIAARKPVIALSTCRQFRALLQDSVGVETIYWAQNFDDVALHLRHVPIQRVDPGIVALAEQESWQKVGKRYAAIYKSLVSA
jgi:hypothetical protein